MRPVRTHGPFIVFLLLLLCVFCILDMLTVYPICLCLAMIVYCVTQEQMMLQVVLVKHRVRAGLDWGKSFIKVFIIYDFEKFCKHLCYRLLYIDSSFI